MKRSLHILLACAAMTCCGCQVVGPLAASLIGGYLRGHDPQREEPVVVSTEHPPEDADEQDSQLGEEPREN